MSGMIDPPVTPTERLSDALFQLANAMGRLRDAFEILHCTLIVGGAPSQPPLDEPRSESP